MKPTLDEQIAKHECKKDPPCMPCPWPVCKNGVEGERLIDPWVPPGQPKRAFIRQGVVTEGRLSYYWEQVAE